MYAFVFVTALKSQMYAFVFIQPSNAARGEPLGKRLSTLASLAAKVRYPSTMAGAGYGLVGLSFMRFMQRSS